LLFGINLEVNGPIGFVPSFGVTDPAAARARLEAAGCRVERVAPDGTGFYARDPFGAVFDVIARPAPPERAES
jgi:hypothetical protein